MKDIAKSQDLQAAWDISSIFADYELQLVANRKRVIENALRTGRFKNAVYEQFNAYDAASDDAARKAFAELHTLTAQEFERTYANSVKTVDIRVAGLIRQGYKAPTASVINTSLVTTAINSTMVAFVRNLHQGKTVATNQLQLITGAVQGEYNVAEQVDRVQRVILSTGIKVQQGATEKDIVSLSEFQMRNSSRDMRLLAEGKRAEEYGISYSLISGHPSSCPLCTPWQNKVVIDDVYGNGKPDGKTPLMSEAIAAGLYHYNCRHERTVYIPGYDNPELYKKDIASPKETAQRYAIEQQQRYNERGIREWKLREAAALTDKERDLAGFKVKEWQARQRDLRDISKREGVPFYRQYSREQIGGDTKPYIKPEADEVIKNLTPEGKQAIIQARNKSGTGKAIAVKIHGSKISKRQNTVLAKLKEPGNTFIGTKKLIKPQDVAVFTAQEGAEFTVFTKGNERLIIRGHSDRIPLTENELKALADEGWRWTSHSHPGVDISATMASQGDMKVLMLFSQKQSVIYNEMGRYSTFRKD